MYIDYDENAILNLGIRDEKAHRLLADRFVSLVPDVAHLSKDLINSCVTLLEKIMKNLDTD